MRQAKYRAWDKDLRRMFYLDKGHFMIGGTGQACMFCSIWLDELIKNNFTKEGRHKPKILMQFTGLLDKNGVEIYEGTIAQTITQDGVRLSKFAYFYNESLARFQKRRYFDGEIYDCDEISEHGKEIIGNIHEHPKLLEEKQ